MIRPVLPSAHPFSANLKAGRVAADGASLGTELQSRIAGMKSQCRYVFGTPVGVLELVFVLFSCGCFSPTEVRQPKLHGKD